MKKPINTINIQTMNFRGVAYTEIHVFRGIIPTSENGGNMLSEYNIVTQARYNRASNMLKAFYDKCPVKGF